MSVWDEIFETFQKSTTDFTNGDIKQKLRDRLKKEGLSQEEIDGLLQEDMELKVLIKLRKSKKLLAVVPENDSRVGSDKVKYITKKDLLNLWFSKWLINQVLIDDSEIVDIKK